MVSYEYIYDTNNFNIWHIHTYIYIIKPDEKNKFENSCTVIYNKKSSINQYIYLSRQKLCKRIS